MAVADFSNDGRLDVFTFDWDYHDNYGIANVLLGSGNGRFSLWETLEFGTDYSGGLGTGDINRDGLTDVAIAAGHDPDTGEPYLTALFNDGNWPSVEPALPGDYNRNGTVDAADYVVWRKNNGTTNALPNDPTGGTIGTAQYNQWHAHFGQTAGGGSGTSASTAVPEPATVVLVGLESFAMFGAFSIRLRARRNERRAEHLQTRSAFLLVFALIAIARAIIPTRSRFVRALVKAAGLAAFAASGLAARAAQYTAVNLYPLEPIGGWNQASPVLGSHTLLAGQPAFAGQVVGTGCRAGRSTAIDSLDRWVSVANGSRTSMQSLGQP